MAIRRIEGLLHLASEGRYAILVGRFNSFVVEQLLGRPPGCGPRDEMGV